MRASPFASSWLCEEVQTDRSISLSLGHTFLRSHRHVCPRSHKHTYCIHAFPLTPSSSLRLLLPLHLSLAFEWLNHVLKCILELRGKSSRLQKFVQFFNSTPIWMHRRGHFQANSGWLKMSRAFLLLCAFGHDVDPAKQTIAELKSENAKCIACQKWSSELIRWFIWMH